MTTIINFNPSATANFQFNCTLDDKACVVVCVYNNYSPRYYFNVYDSARNLLLTRPIIGSPDDYDIDMLFGYFTTSKMIYRVSSNNFEITP